ncbi:MAG: tryptophan synthase subunit alpha [Lentisphaeria bacterium]|jgi:tryptophan synthase alpha chain
MQPRTIEQTFAACKAQGRKALVTYVTAGDPDLAVTERLLPELASAGADMIELGAPFSDPMADGPTIQAACQRALKAGTTLPKILAMMRRLHGRLPCPVVLFGYYNVFLQYGLERLAAELPACGIEGLLVVDLPHEEAAELEPALAAHGLSRITLLAPTTPPERAATLLKAARGFVYYITVTGVTGARKELPADLAAKLAALRRLSPVPVVAGFGVGTPEQARQVAAHADGVVVGSALVQRLATAESPAAGVAAATALVREIAAALRG